MIYNNKFFSSNGNSEKQSELQMGFDDPPTLTEGRRFKSHLELGFCSEFFPFDAKKLLLYFLQKTEN